MAELDYTFVAEYAKVEDGKLTAVGASFLHVNPTQFPSLQLLSVAGRVRAPEGTSSVALTIIVTPPEPGVAITINGILSPDTSTVVYDGKFGIIFAVSTMVQLTGPGLVNIDINVDGSAARHLAFEVRPIS